jgi:hypothetical protein
MTDCNGVELNWTRPSPHVPDGRSLERKSINDKKPATEKDEEKSRTMPRSGYVNAPAGAPAEDLAPTKSLDATVHIDSTQWLLYGLILKRI